MRQPTVGMAVWRGLSYTGAAMRQAFTASILVAGISLALTSPAGARGNPHFKRGVKLLDQAEDEQALEAFRQALKWPGTRSKRNRARIHVYIGITQLNLTNEEEARKHFGIAFRLDPRARLPDGLSPKIEQIAGEVRAQQGSTPAAPPPVVPPPAPVTSPVTPVVTRRAVSSPWTYWPAWTALGAAVAAGGTGLALGLISRKRADEASDLGLPTSLAQSKHDTASNMALTANVLFGVAGAAAITAGVLFYVGSQRSPATAEVVPLRGGALVQVHGLTW